MKGIKFKMDSEEGRCESSELRHKTIYSLMIAE
jgi:hypothetical protein